MSAKYSKPKTAEKSNSQNNKIIKSLINIIKN